MIFLTMVNDKLQLQVQSVSTIHEDLYLDNGVHQHNYEQWPMREINKSVSVCWVVEGGLRCAHIIACIINQSIMVSKNTAATYQ